MNRAERVHEMIAAVAANPERPVPSRVGNTAALEETNGSRKLQLHVREIVGQRRNNWSLIDVRIEDLRVGVVAAEELAEPTQGRFEDRLGRVVSRRDVRKIKPRGVDPREDAGTRS